MDPLFVDWLGLLLRWAHVMIGILWIGTSFHFIWLDASLRPLAQAPEKGIAGETWMVHGGGFYRARKYLVAPEALPASLHWFKYEAYFTWITGFLLLAVVYYLGADLYLIDRAVLDLAAWQAIAISAGSLALGWLVYDSLCRSPVGRRTGMLAGAVFLLAVAAAFGYGQVFSGRAAYLHVGALLGTIMAANVFFVIIPNQKKVVADLLAGRVPDPALGAQAKRCSLHNNYLTLPVVLMMISNHYPMLYGHTHSWAFVAGALVIGGLVRHFYNRKDAGERGWRIAWPLPAAAAVTFLLIALSGYRPQQGGTTAGTAAAAPVTLAQVMPVIRDRCVTCHSARPTDPAFDAPPAGVAFDTAEEVRRNAQRILARAVLSDGMPLGNKTGMVPEERALLGRWIENGAP